jgi:hypothetical protein
MMHMIVTSASGASGNGYGAILGFGPEGEFTGWFSSDPRIADPAVCPLTRQAHSSTRTAATTEYWRLNSTGTSARLGVDARTRPGRRRVRPDGRSCVTMRRQRAILAMPAALDSEGEFLLPEGIVPFPRGFGPTATLWSPANGRSALPTLCRAWPSISRTGSFVGPVVQLARLNGQALVLVPWLPEVPACKRLQDVQPRRPSPAGLRRSVRTRVLDALLVGELGRIALNGATGLSN